MKSDNASGSAAATSTLPINDAARKELRCAGVAKVGVVFAPAASTFFVVRDSEGNPRGVTVDLGKALAQTLAVEPEFFVAPNSGELTDALEQGLIDVAFFPVDDERKSRVEFGPAYFIIETTGLVRADSGFATTDDLNRKGVRVAGIANTTTIRSAARVLPVASIIAATSVGEAMDMLKNKDADAVVLARDVLPAYQSYVPGSRILDGRLHTTRISIAVSKGRPGLLACISTFMESAKTSGLVRRAFDQAGFSSEKVAPLEDAE